MPKPSWHPPWKLYRVRIFKLIKCATRDAFLYMGEATPLDPSDPHFLFAIALQPLGGFFSYLAGVCSSLGKFSEYASMTFSPIREVTRRKMRFFLEGHPCPDDNLQSILSIHLKFSRYLPHIKIWATLNFGRDRLKMTELLMIT